MGTGADALVGKSLAGYGIEARIGSGAMGTVYRARHPDQPGPVALKVLHDNMGAVTSLRRRFEREARALAKIGHERIVGITDFGVADNLTFIAMELLSGTTLEDELAEAPIDVERALRITRDVLGGLAYAHSLQMVHRDLKPANVFLQRGGGGGELVKILDFGLVKFLSIDEISQEGTLTRKGRIVGTPAYMAPEQITGVSLDARADVYAVGVVLYELLADRRPFTYDRRSELLRAHLCEPVLPLDSVRPGLTVGPALETLVQRALRKDPNERWQTAGDMLAAMEALPPGSVRFESTGRTTGRKRGGTFSGVLSAEELREVADSVASAPGLAIPSTPPPPPVDAAPVEPPLPAASPPEAFDDSTNESIPVGTIPASVTTSSRPPRPRPEAPAAGLTVGAWWAIALVLAAIAAVLWWTLGQP
jgi:serine/threonine-protein kinase